MKISERISRIAERVSKMTRRLCVYDFDDTLVSSESSVTVEHGDGEKTVLDRSESTRLNSSHRSLSRMPSSA